MPRHVHSKALNPARRGAQVIRHEVYDSKADVFSWGVLFAELLTGRPPYGDAYLTPVQARPCSSRQQATTAGFKHRHIVSVPPRVARSC